MRIHNQNFSTVWSWWINSGGMSFLWGWADHPEQTFQYLLESEQSPGTWVGEEGAVELVLVTGGHLAFAVSFSVIPCPSARPTVLCPQPCLVLSSKSVHFCWGGRKVCRCLSVSQTAFQPMCLLFTFLSILSAATANYKAEWKRFRNKGSRILASLFLVQKSISQVSSKFLRTFHLFFN